MGKQTHLYHTLCSHAATFLAGSKRAHMASPGLCWKRVGGPGWRRGGGGGGAVVDSPGGSWWAHLGNCQVWVHKVKPGGGPDDGYDVRSFYANKTLKENKGSG